MSILIKGMEMPTDGEMLCINIYPSGTVCINLDLKCKMGPLWTCPWRKKAKQDGKDKA